jgi:hypothetical protein
MFYSGMPPQVWIQVLKPNYWTKELKTAEIILIHKPGKDPTKIESY